MYLGSIFFVKWVPILDWSHWTKLDTQAERLWRLQPAVQLIYTVCMYVRYVYKEKRKKVTTHKR